MGAYIKWDPNEKMVGVLFNEQYLQLWIDNPKSLINFTKEEYLIF